MPLKKIITLGRMRNWAKKQKRCTARANVRALIDSQIADCGGNENSIVVRLTGERAKKFIKLVNEGIL